MDTRAVAHALLRTVFALLRTPSCGSKPGVHTSVNAARMSACATSGGNLSRHALPPHQNRRRRPPRGRSVEIAGWLYNLRKSGKIVFPLLRDGTGIMQCVAVKANLDEALFETLKNLTQESSLILRGKIRAEQRAPGGYEMDVEAAEVIHRVPESDPYPITPKEHGPDF